eukprot:1182484-Prorocentrum_minimum.AAC.1
MLVSHASQYSCCRAPASSCRGACASVVSRCCVCTAGFWRCFASSVPCERDGLHTFSLASCAGSSPMLGSCALPTLATPLRAT